MKEIKLTTLCYIERDNKYLMMHRTKKKNDINEVWEAILKSVKALKNACFVK